MKLYKQFDTLNFIIYFQYQSIKISWSIPIFIDWLCWGFWCIQNCNIIMNNRLPWPRIETDGWRRCQVAGCYEVASFVRPIPWSSHKMNFYTRPVSKHKTYLVEFLLMRRSNCHACSRVSDNCLAQSRSFVRPESRICLARNFHTGLENQEKQGEKKAID